MACPTRRSPSARCSPPRRRATPWAARCRSLLVMVLKPSWSLYRGRARGRERVRPNERAIFKHTTTRGSAASRSADFRQPSRSADRTSDLRAERPDRPPLRDPPRQRGKRREVGIDDRSCEHPQPVDRARAEMPIGPPSCTIDRSSRGTAEVERRTRSSASRRRADPRRRPPQRHPNVNWPSQPRHHLDLPARHRERRDHRHRPCPTRAHDPGNHRAGSLARSASPPRPTRVPPCCRPSDGDSHSR